MRWAQNGTERVNGVLFNCLTTYTGMSYILWASRRPCGTYKAGQWLCAPSDSELGTWSLGLGVPLGNAEHSGRVVGDLRGTLDVNPNPNGILPLHHVQASSVNPPQPSRLERAVQQSKEGAERVMQAQQNKQLGFWDIIQNNNIFGHDTANVAYLTEL